MKRARMAVAALVGMLVLASVGPGTTPASAQESLVYPRPIPGPVVPPRFYRAALERGTRSHDGSPGPGYYQNWADYDIDARLDPETGILTGRETIRYHNRAPVRLSGLVIHLHQNHHAMGVERRREAEITGGVNLQSVRVQGREVREGSLQNRPAYQVDGTIMNLTLPENVGPGETVELDLEWTFTVPQSGAGRMGWSEREMYYMAYWFPQIAVLDDLRGFDAEQYTGEAEFYADYGDYDLSLTVPEGWTVMSTGSLENPEEVLTQQSRSRLAAASTADTVVTVASLEDLEAGRVTARSGNGWLTWEFRADSVRDVAWTTSNAQVWNSTSASVPDRDGDGSPERVAIHSFYRPDRAPLWADQTPYGKYSIEHHSRYTGLSYPWPHMTSVEGADIIGGGMEFPMMTVMGSYRGRTAEDLFNVTSHEIAHMWVPMIVGTNEKRYEWMDEGFTTFLEDESRISRQERNAHHLERDDYLSRARAEAEEPLMRHGDHYWLGGGGTASYDKPATLLFTLRNLLGREVFEEAYRTYHREWAFKHPAPWDLFNTIERVSGRDLDWFWQAFVYETWAMDHAVAGVERGQDGRITVAVEDRGFAPMPAIVLIETGDGEVLEREIPVEHWLRGETIGRVVLPADVGRVVRVRLDPEELYPDMDRSNDVWEAGTDGGR